MRLCDATRCWSFAGAILLLCASLNHVSGQSTDPTIAPSSSTVQPEIRDVENDTATSTTAAASSATATVFAKQGMCPNDLMDPLLCATGGTKDQCSTDADCSGASKCCSTGCMKVCIQPLFTACQHKKKATEERWRMLQEEGVDNPEREERMLGLPPPPGCSNEGDFQQVQCNGLDEDCWCIDSTGFEMPGTRARSLDLVNCSQPRPCAGFMCRMLCPYGFELDEEGCPLCECRDPCKGVKCPGNTQCQLKEVPCAKEPCPPIPTCKKARSLNELCLTGPPLKMSETEKPFLCGVDPGKPECPPMFECSVQPGHDYGVCCPAAEHIQKPGMCPVSPDTGLCGKTCQHDLDCEGTQKCCSSETCGSICVEPHKMTVCHQQKMISELLLAKQEPGKGYIPQCHPVTGEFYPKQCSRNGLVCWCVDPDGRKLPRSFGRSHEVKCLQDGAPPARPRSICGPLQCAATCEFGYLYDEDGCPTCQCEDPCKGVPCGPDMKCVPIKDENCTLSDSIDGERANCPVYPECRPVLRLRNPCALGTPLMHEATGGLVTCYPGVMSCPAGSSCTLDPETRDAVCCPTSVEESKPGSCPFLSKDRISRMACNAEPECESDADCGGKLKCCSLGNECGNVCAGPVVEELSEERNADPKEEEVQNPVVEPQALNHNVGSSKAAAELSPPPKAVAASDESVQISICQYLRNMGLAEEVRLAIPTPACAESGAFEEKQCDGVDCWCVDNFGVEIPRTRNVTEPTEDCIEYRKTHDCLGVRCRLGCEYGFKLDDTTGCPLCECQDLCEVSNCPEGAHCEMSMVKCDKGTLVCPSVPVCVPDIVTIDEVRFPPTCPFGDPYVVPILNATVECKVEDGTIYGCPQDFSCLTHPESDGKGICCPRATPDQCQQPISVGDCLENDVEVERWAYDSSKGTCEKLMYSGCGGNLNNFADKKTCEKYCVATAEAVKAAANAVPHLFEDAANVQQGKNAQKPGAGIKPGQCPYLVPLENGNCEYECTHDHDCFDTHKCCSNGCGTQCVPPLIMTACQHQRAVLEHGNRERGLPQSHAYLPKCDNDGLFELIQCNPRSRVCWCVDTNNGKELPGTRAAPGYRPDCFARAPCPALSCNATCSEGYQLDEYGCPSCQCHDPCRGIRCDEFTEECRLVQVNCITEPCPSIPMCLPKLKNPCAGGDPLVDPDNGQFVTCGPVAGQCPSSHKCHLSPLGEYAVCCPKPRETCFMGLEPGKCSASEEKWYFNPVANKCDKFTFTGCGGNLNQFDSEADCRKTCPVLTKCQKMKEANRDISLKYKKSMFIPSCDEESGDWKNVQCMDELGLCWCVDREGKPVKGTMMRGIPQCSARRSRMMLLANTIDEDEICPDGLAVHQCNKTLCDDLVCLSQQNALCRVNPCGGCHPEFYDELGILVNCEDQLGRCHTEMQTILNSPAWLNQKIGREARGSAAFFNPIQALSNPPVQSGVLVQMNQRPARVRALNPPRLQSYSNAPLSRPVAIDLEFEPTGASSSESPLTSLIDLLAALLPKGPIFQRSSSNTGYSERTGEVAVGLGTHLGINEEGPVAREGIIDEGPRIRIIELRRKKRQVGAETNFDMDAEFSEPEDLEAVESQMMVAVLQPTVKPGVCPALGVPSLKKVLSRNCSDRCASDGDCANQQKCCMSECGSKCVAPEFERTPKPGVCPRITADLDFLKCIPSQECYFDADCPGSAKCCYTGCGAKCLQAQAPVFESPVMLVTPPQCDRDGYFLPTQHQGEFSWCVDSQGYPLHQTMTRGFVQCDRQGRIVKRESLGPVCPNSRPSKVCHQECLRVRCPAHPDAICVADPCNECRIRFITTSGEEVRCEEKCSQPRSIGNCRAAIGRFWFNQTAGQCQPFTYSGCGANDNNFESMEACEENCLEKVEVCLQPRRTGMCRAHMTRWWYNPAAQRCQIFHYGGCGGNLNNFETKEACENTCPDVVLCPKWRADNPDPEPCSRRDSCRNITCPQLEGSSCKVDPCTCTGSLVDSEGNPVICPTFTSTELPEQEKVTEMVDARGDLSVAIKAFEAEVIGGKSDFESETTEKKIFEENKLPAMCADLRDKVMGSDAKYIPECDENGAFKPTQCHRTPADEDKPLCWCIDDAGNRDSHSGEFLRGQYECQRIPIVSIEIELAFIPRKAQLTIEVANKIRQQIAKVLDQLPEKPQHGGVVAEVRKNYIMTRFTFSGPRRIDASHFLQQKVQDGKVFVQVDDVAVPANIDASTFVHNAASEYINEVPQFFSTETRQIVDAPGLDTPYLAVIIVFSALTGIVLAGLGIAMFLYRRKLTGSYPKSGKNSPTTGSTTSTISSVSSTLGGVNSPLYAYETKNQLARHFEDDYSYEHGRKFSITSTDGGCSFTHEYEVVTETDGHKNDGIEPIHRNGKSLH